MEEAPGTRLDDTPEAHPAPCSIRHSPGSGFREHGRRCGRGLSRGMLAAAAVACLLAPAACSEAEPYKPTFFGRTGGVREPASQPEGLNPLGAIPSCADGPVQGQGEERVLVARPDLFTREASLMISTLRQAIADNYKGPRTVRFLVTQRFVQTEAQAIAEGKRCASLIVLWESYGTRALELTLPDPARIPLKAQPHPRLCEFGNYAEQLQILYLTIAALLATVDNDYESANSDMELATRIDTHCLQLPKGSAASPASPSPRRGDAPGSGH